MAKDGTARGGQRVGAGRKPKALADKVAQGSTGPVLVFPDPADLKGEDVPPVKEFLKASQKVGVDLCAEDVFKSTFTWLKERGCDRLVNSQLIEQYAMSVSRWVQCEIMISKYGFLGNRKLFDVMTKGSGDARMQPLYFLITTAGTDTKSICYETHQKAKDILAGRKIDPTFYPVIYGADENDDWTDPKVWKKANPSLGITVGIDKVVAACESAKQNPAEENSFRQLRLNQWVKQSVRWMSLEKWDKCDFTVDPEALEGRVCYGGLDLSSTTDITAFALVFPPLDEEDKYYVLPYFWIPEETLDLRVRRDHVPYDVYEKEGRHSASVK